MIDVDLDKIYQSPLKEFVAERNALAASLKKAGNAAASENVRALRKPSASAWAVNQLYWQARDAFDALVAAGDAYRASLARGRDDAAAEAAADAERDRRASIETAIRTARSILEGSGQSATDAVMRRIATTLDALASYGSDNPEPMRGRLTDDLEPAGFAAFGGLTPALVPPAPARAPAKDVVAEKEKALETARRRLEQANTYARTVRERMESLTAQLVQAERAAEDAAAGVNAAEAALEEANPHET